MERIKHISIFLLLIIGLMASAPLLCSIGRSTQLVCQFKEPVFLSFLRLQPSLDELNENSVRAGLLVLGQSLDPLGQARG